MTRYEAFAAMVDAAKPASVAMAFVDRPELDGLSIFFVGPRGRAACPFLGIGARLESNDTATLLEMALAKAAEVA